MTVAAYDSYADYYDLVFRRHTEDLSFWAQLIHPGAVVAEVGCGSGRILATLTAASELVGIDPSSEMLAKAERRLPATARLYQSTIQDTSLPAEHYDVILAPRGALAHILDKETRVQGLKKIFDALKVGGRFVLDVPDYTSMPQLFNTHNEYTHEYSIRTSRGTLDFHVASSFDAASRTLTLHHRVFDITDGDGNAKASYDLETVVRNLDEWSSELATAGFETHETYGGYDLSPSDESTSRFIVMTTRPR